MSNQVVGSRLLGAIVFVSLFAACTPQPSTAAPPASYPPAEPPAKSSLIPTAAVTPSPAATAAASRRRSSFSERSPAFCSIGESETTGEFSAKICLGCHG